MGITAKNRKSFIVVLVLTLVLAIMACGLSGNGDDAEDVQTDSSVEGVENENQSGSMEVNDDSADELYDSQTDEEQLPPIDIFTETEEIIDEPVDEGSEESMPPDTPVEELPPPEPKEGLQASNPDMFSLASGEFQFVELFAFW